MSNRRKIYVIKQGQLTLNMYTNVLYIMLFNTGDRTPNLIKNKDCKMMKIRK